MSSAVNVLRVGPPYVEMRRCQPSSSTCRGRPEHEKATNLGEPHVDLAARQDAGMRAELARQTRDGDLYACVKSVDASGRREATLTILARSSPRSFSYCRMSAEAASPSSTGICTSTRTISYLAALNSSKASAPSAASAKRIPFVLRKVARIRLRREIVNDCRALTEALKLTERWDCRPQ